MKGVGYAKFPSGSPSISNKSPCQVSAEHVSKSTLLSNVSLQGSTVKISTFVLIIHGNIQGSTFCWAMIVRKNQLRACRSWQLSCHHADLRIGIRETCWHSIWPALTLIIGDALVKPALCSSKLQPTHTISIEHERCRLRSFFVWWPSRIVDSTWKAWAALCYAAAAWPYSLWAMSLDPLHNLLPSMFYHYHSTQELLHIHVWLV